jgi:hypothetical protein
MISTEQIEEHKQETLKLLRSVKRDGIEKLVDFLEESDYFSAPASTKFHGNYEGGLAHHSYEVYKGFKRQVEFYKIDIPDESVVLTGLCHDLCKVGLYQQNTLKNGEKSESKPYRVEDKFPLGHGEKSVSILQRYICLTDQEAMIIRWHMGAYDPSFDSYKDSIKEKFPEAILFHNVDIEVSMLKNI